jgi:hypothetical protein
VPLFFPAVGIASILAFFLFVEEERLKVEDTRPEGCIGVCGSGFTGLPFFMPKVALSLYGYFNFISFIFPNYLSVKM